MTKRTTFSTPEEQHKFMALSAAKTRQATRQAQIDETAEALDRWMHRWRTDPESILAERRWTCPECGATVEPFVIEGLKGRPIVGRRERCACGYVEETESDVD